MLKVSQSRTECYKPVIIMNIHYNVELEIETLVLVQNIIIEKRLHTQDSNSALPTTPKYH